MSRAPALTKKPAAAVCADLLAREMDFLGIGSNDLTQYTLAVDRTNKEVADLFEPFHPAMLRIYRNMIQVASSAGKTITVCGELASESESAACPSGRTISLATWNSCARTWKPFAIGRSRDARPTSRSSRI